MQKILATWVLTPLQAAYLVQRFQHPWFMQIYLFSWFEDWNIRRRTRSHVLVTGICASGAEAFVLEHGCGARAAEEHASSVDALMMGAADWEGSVGAILGAATRIWSAENSEMGWDAARVTKRKMLNVHQIRLNWRNEAWDCLLKKTDCLRIHDLLISWINQRACFQNQWDKQDCMAIFQRYLPYQKRGDLADLIGRDAHTGKTWFTPDFVLSGWRDLR
jgi:hypothetical protein